MRTLYGGLLSIYVSDFEARDRWISSTIPFGGRIGESREAFPRSKDLQETRESLMAYMTCHVRSTCGRAFPSRFPHFYSWTNNYADIWVKRLE